MRRALATFLLLFATFGVALSAQQRIVPLGDSITESSAGRAGYRFFLWKRFDQAKVCVDFVGSRHGVAAGLPLFDDFDQDHSGFSGYPAVWVEQLMRLAPTSVPVADIALVHLGTNDIVRPLLLGLPPDLQRAAKSLEHIVEQLRQRNPAVKIAIAKILPIEPNVSAAPTAYTYVPIWNEQYLPRLQQLSTAASPIVLVDMNTGVKPSVHLADEVHPNELGAQLMADRWFAALAANGWLPAPSRCVGTLSPGCSTGPRVKVPQLAVHNPAVGGRMDLIVKGLPDEADAVAIVIGASESAPPFSWTGCPLHPSLDVILYAWFPTRQFVSDLTFATNVPNVTPPGFEIYVQAMVSTLRPGAGAVSNGLQVVLF